MRTRWSTTRRSTILLAVVGVLAALAVQPGSAGPDVRATEGDLLDGPSHGGAAIAELGPQLAVAAAVNDMSVRELRALLLSDPSAWLDGDGRLFYKEPIPDLPAPAALPAVERAPFPYAKTFRLHSRPRSQRTIYLDFTGGTVSGTEWNAIPGMGSRHPAWDLDGRPGSFSRAERDAIQKIWQYVAEDYAVLDIDVTTEDPGKAALTRTGVRDKTYGSWALITPSIKAANAICGGGCGGVAYVGTFNVVGSGAYQPAWTFPHLLGNDPKVIAEATSHEVGHNLGLFHDGHLGSEYYFGHGSWAPIMGAGYSNPITQWSAGEYTGASNIEDDFAVMKSHGVSRLADDHGDTRTSATALGGRASYAGVITTRTDIDYFSLELDCTGVLTADAQPSSVSPNLDIRLRLLDSTGGEVAAADPVSGTSTYEVATGMSALISQSLPAGTYYLAVDGVGVSGADGYSDYGSVGPYRLTATGCLVPPPVTRPGPAVIGRASSGAPGGQVTATSRWTPPTSTGGTRITGYQVVALRLNTRGQVVGNVTTPTLPARLRQKELRLPRPGTWVFRVRAVNVVGNGPLSGRSNRVVAR